LQALIMRILIADDDRDTVMTLGILLRSEGHEVRLVEHSHEVPDAVRQFRPGVVLLDIGMPVRSGYDIAQELSRTYGAACPTLVAVTALKSAAARAKADDSGFHHFVSKPYDPVMLLSLVERLDR
jgi:CheY-like chemotaxis protein